MAVYQILYSVDEPAYRRLYNQCIDRSLSVVSIIRRLTAEGEEPLYTVRFYGKSHKGKDYSFSWVMTEPCLNYLGNALSLPDFR